MWQEPDLFYFKVLLGMCLKGKQDATVFPAEFRTSCFLHKTQRIYFLKTGRGAELRIIIIHEY